MCLGVPFRIVRIEGTKARGVAFGLEKEIDLRLLEEAMVGDYVLVHAGFAIQKIDPEEAEENARLFREFLSEAR